MVNSPFAKMFLAIMARIEAELPEIKHIDQDFGQLEGNSPRPAIAFPCVLVDFKAFTSDNLGGNSQTVEGNVSVRLAMAQFNDTSSINDPLWREFGLGFYDLEWKLNKALHAWSPGAEFGYLTRTNMDSENRPAGIRLRPLIYRIEFEDHSVAEAQNTVSGVDVIVTN
jgi:hypothetical protein